MKNKKMYILSVIVCLLPMILGVILYDKLPNEMAIHFNINDVPDNFASKDFALFGLPIFLAIMQLITVGIIQLRLKKVENISEQTPSVIKILYYWIIPFISLLVYLVMIGYSLNIFTDVGSLICLPLGILFIVIGNYLPKVNYEVGRHMSHPGFKSEVSFRKSAKVMGVFFILLGITFVVFAIIRLIK